MQMKGIVTMIVATMAAMMAWANCGSCPGDQATTNKSAACCKAGDTVYVCDACKVVAPKAGACEKCKAEMKAAHVLAMKDGKVSLCPCGAACKCTLKTDDPTQCSCGKAVTTLDCAKACPASKTPEAKPKSAPESK